MFREVLKFPTHMTALRQKSTPLDVDSEEASHLITDLHDSFKVLEGLGLAAPQIGIFRRAIIVSPCNLGISNEEALIMLNPVVIPAGDEEQFLEACFSVPYVQSLVTRTNKCTVKFVTEKGEEKSLDVSGLASACIQHEIDHLDGILYIDRISRLKRQILLKKIKKITKNEKQILEQKRREFMEDHESLQYGYDAEAKPKTTYSKKRKLKARRKRPRNRRR